MKRTLLLLIAGVLSISSAVAQENPPVQEEKQTGETVVQRGVQIVAAASEDGGAPKIQYFATTDGTGGDFMIMGDPSMGGVGAPDAFSLVNNKSVQKEIELVDEQLKQLNDIRNDFSKKISAQLGDLTKGGFDASRTSGIKELMAKLKNQQKDQMHNILLPHQLDRLKQIALQVQMKRSGEMATLASKQIAEELGIDDKQKKHLEQRAKEIKAKLEAKIQKLKEQAKDDLLDELTGSQRAKLKEMTGANFELKTENWRDRIKRLRTRKSSDNK